MVTQLKSGVTIQSDAEGSIVQSVKVSHKAEKDLVSGMVDGKSQIVKVFDHTETFPFSVEGKGDLTFAAGLGQDPAITLLPGTGVSFIDEFSYEQKLPGSSMWNYSGEHYEHAA